MHSNKVHGSGGCNRFGGTYSLDGDKLTFVHLLATKKFCEGASEVKNQFISYLQSAPGFCVIDEPVCLFSKVNKQLHFEGVNLQ